jgi:hypothetical protein
MFTYRRKIRSSHTTTIWGATSRASGSETSGCGTLCVQVEEIGDAVELEVCECWLWFFSRTRTIGLVAGDVYSLDLSTVIRLTARCDKGNDTFLNCAILPNG